MINEKFTADQNGEKINFDPEIWGHDAWRFIHLIALSYPSTPQNELKNQYLTWFKLLGNILPCAECGKNYKKHLISHTA